MEIDEKLLKKINRQLRGIKVLLSMFFLMIVAMLIILGFIAYKVVSFTREVNNKIETIQQTTSQKLDLKSQLCDNNQTNYLSQQLCE